MPDLPRDWILSSFGELVPSERPICYGVLKPGPHVPEGVPLVRIVDLIDGEVRVNELHYVSNELDEEFSRSRLEGGEILLSIQGTIGRVAITPAELKGGNISRTLARIALNGSTEPGYVAQWMRSGLGQAAFDGAVVGTTRSSLNIGALRKILVPLPPLPEQRKIAAILSSVDDAIAATRKVIEQTKRVKQGLLQTLMTRGIGHTRFKKTEIGEIPEAWEVRVVEDCCEILDRHRVPLNSDERRERQGPIPYWGANGIVDHIDDFIFDEALVLIAEDGGYFDDAAQRPIAHLVDGKIWVNNHAHVLRVTDHVSREWFYFWFVHRDITPYINSGTRAKLNQQDLRQLPVAVPPADEQMRIVRALQSLRKSGSVHEQALKRLNVLKSGLMQDLLTGRVRVQSD